MVPSFPLILFFNFLSETRFQLLEVILAYGGAYIASCLSTELSFNLGSVADLNADHHTTNEISTKTEQN